MGSSLGHRSTRHGKRDGRRAGPRAVGYQVCVVNQGLTKHAILMYREIIRIKQRWQRCVVGGWGLEDADRRIDIRAKGLLHVDRREPPTPFLGVAQRCSSLHGKSEYFITQNFGVHSRLHRMGDTPSSRLDTDGLCR
jgi:hypothetical protein